jgi:hypothetical protein
MTGEILFDLHALFSVLVPRLLELHTFLFLFNQQLCQQRCLRCGDGY